MSGLAAGCGSSTPAYCTDASQLKTSVGNLGNVDVAKDGLGSLQTALSKVQADAKTFAADAKPAFPPQTAITSAKGQPDGDPQPRRSRHRSSR